MGHASSRLRPAATAVATAGLATMLVSGQSAARNAAPSPEPNTSATWRTPWGHPDLQGVWTNATYTPLERPAGTGEAQVLSATELQHEEEARMFEYACHEGNYGIVNVLRSTCR